MSINEIVSIVLKVVCFILVAFVIPVLKKKYTREQLEDVNNTIHMYVEAAEQIFGVDQGTEKKQWVQERLKASGIDVNLAAVDAEIEAYVLILHNALKYE